MKRLLLLAVVALVLAPLAATSSPSMGCRVSSPISAAEVNSVNPVWPWLLGDPGTWYFEVFGATPNAQYHVKIQWAGDPSNGGHPSAGISTNSTGFGRTALPRWWAPDGSLPGFSTGTGLENFTAIPDVFSVHIYTRPDSIAKGTANCKGEVLP